MIPHVINSEVRKLKCNMLNFKLCNRKHEIYFFKYSQLLYGGEVVGVLLIPAKTDSQRIAQFSVLGKFSEQQCCIVVFFSIITWNFLFKAGFC